MKLIPLIFVNIREAVKVPFLPRDPIRGEKLRNPVIPVFALVGLFHPGSAGWDGIVQTSPTDTTPSGDDIGFILFTSRPDCIINQS